MTIKEETKKRIYLFAASLILGLYFALGFYFAVNTADGVYPDEGHHSILSQRYSEEVGVLDDSADLYHFGQVSHQPFLYHWAMGRVLEYDPFDLDDRLLLRGLSVVLGSISVLFYFLTAREFTKNRVVQLLSVFAVVNTLMYMFMSAAVNYDTFAVLFSSASIYFFVRFVKYLDIENVFWIISLLTLGILSKISMFPLALVIALLTVFHTIINWKIVSHNLLRISLSRALLGTMTVFLITVGIWFYGENLLQYGQIVPDCDKVLSVDSCSHSLQYLRDKTMEAESASVERMNLFAYLGTWFMLILIGTFGIFGHFAILRSLISLLPYITLLLLGSFSTVRFVRTKDTLSLYLILIVSFYIFFLLFFVNYDAYLKLGDAGVGVHGRYLFPVYFPLILILFRHIFELIMVRWVQFVFALIIVLWFLYGGIGYYYRYASADFVRSCDYIIELPNCSE